MSPASLLLLTLLIDAPRPAPAAPRFAPAPCPIEVAPDERIDCGVLLVPENRGKPGSRTIRLPVVIFRSRSAHPAPDPLLFLAGGPGATAVARRRSGKGLPFLDERDFIVLEQRGTRHAEPALECPGINALTAEIAAGRLHGDAARAAFVDAAAVCRKALVASGADLDGYTSAASADDVEDLRRALGYEKWNLFGISYGTRLALTVLRRHPAGVRSAVLDSVLPPEASFDEGASQNLLRALGVVFDGCAVDRECSIAIPDLRERFARLVAAADRKPLALALPQAPKGGPPVVVRGAQVVDAIYAALHDPAAIPHIPRIVSAAAAGRTDELAPLVEGNQGPSRLSWGMRLSVWCAEEMPFERPERIAAQLSPALGLGGIDETTTSPEVCRAWGVAPAPAIENEPVKSDVPTLVFAGELDPDTPPDWGRRLLVSMPNARYVELRGLSHGAGSSPCGTQISRAFLADPLAPLDAGCSFRLRGADFSLSARPRGER
jgi:pimeloyl-ACP methyl ester carboxylesterase